MVPARAECLCVNCIKTKAASLINWQRRWCRDSEQFVGDAKLEEWCTTGYTPMIPGTQLAHMVHEGCRLVKAPGHNTLWHIILANGMDDDNREYRHHVAIDLAFNEPDTVLVP